MAAVHSILPDALTAAVAAVLDAAGLRHVAHGVGDIIAAATAAAEDRRRSR